jgi:hypothetical protein
MLSLLDPRIWLIAIVALVGAFAAGHHKGYGLSELEQAAAIAQANEQARKVEQVMNEELTKMSNKLRENQNAAKAQIETLRTDIAIGAVRLSVGTKTGVCAATDTTAASGDQQTRTELDPKTADALVAITADGDSAIRKLNACVDSYNQIANQVRLK